IPEDIENFPAIRDTLSEVMAFTSGRHAENVKVIVLPLLGLIAVVVMFIAKTPRVVVPLAVVVSALSIWGFLWTRSNPNMPDKIRRGAWIYIWLIFISAIKALGVLWLRSK